MPCLPFLMVPKVNRILKQIKTIIPLTMQPAVKPHSLLQHRTAMGKVINHSTKTHIPSTINHLNNTVAIAGDYSYRSQDRLQLFQHLGSSLLECTSVRHIIARITTWGDRKQATVQTRFIYTNGQSIQGLQCKSLDNIPSFMQANTTPI